VLLADDVINAPKKPTAALVEAYAAQPETCLSVMEVPLSEAPKYGMVVPGSEPGEVRGLVEKPAPDAAPSRLASIGRYVLEPEIFDILRDLAPGAGGEIQLADALNIRAGEGHVRSVTLDGRRYDCGSKFGYLEAIVDHAVEHPEFGARFQALIEHRVRARDAA